MKTQLLIERLEAHEANIVIENTPINVLDELIENAIDKHVKSMCLKGVFMQAELRNRNGRTYPLTEMINAVAQINEQIAANNGVLGELDHPESLSISTRNASHVITEIKMDGNNAIGKARLLNTPAGLIAQEIYKSGIRPAVSSRGAGSVNEHGIVEGFNLITVDIVATNSAPGANPSTMYESLQGRKVLTLAEAVQQDKAAQKFFKKEINKFIRDIILEIGKK